ncbi:MAG: type II toxin-antitoxin system RelE/ParE family toxin [Nanoarchaeota archaeon]|nr:type II toxin-antitoxin system RelE/ParE family toxin [Nanoarchaeota archaeon]
MAKVEIVAPLFEEIRKKFKAESHKIIDLMESLEENPNKGKPLGNVGGIAIKEIRYKSFRFYFITDGHKLKFFNEESLTDLLIRFVRMSDKKHQQRTINEIKKILLNFGFEGFND